MAVAGSRLGAPFVALVAAAAVLLAALAGAAPQSPSTARPVSAPTSYPAAGTGFEGRAGRVAGVVGNGFVAARVRVDGGLVVQVTGAAAASRARALRGVAAVRRVPLSRDALDAAGNAVVRAATALDLPDFGVWADAGRGQVVFAGGPVHDAQRSALESAASPAGLRVSPALHAHETTAGYPITLGAFECSSGFDVADHGVTTFYGLTAGHCASTGTAVASGTVSLGTILGSTTGTRSTFSDSAYFGPIDPNADYTTATTFTANKATAPVRGYLKNSGIVKGTKICISGARSGHQTCGPVIRENIALRFGNQVVKGNACIAARVRHGDSGGPVYERRGSGVFAAGLITSGTHIRLGGQNVPIACFTKIADALRFWNLVILVP